MNNVSLLLLSLPFIVGGSINFFFPDFAIAASRDLASTLQTDKAMPSIFYSRTACRLVGAFALGLGSLLVIVWLISARRG